MISSCSDDDSTSMTNPFESKWVVENVIYPNPDGHYQPHLETSNSNNITFFREFIFTNNEYVIRNNDLI